MSFKIDLKLVQDILTRAGFIILIQRRRQTSTGPYLPPLWTAYRMKPSCSTQWRENFIDV